MQHKSNSNIVLKHEIKLTKLNIIWIFKVKLL